MKAWEFRAVAWEADVYCLACLPEGVSLDSEAVSPIFPTSEWDSYPTCCICHERHTYVGLTSEGRYYEEHLAWHRADWGDEVELEEPYRFSLWDISHRFSFVEALWVYALDFGQYALLDRLEHKTQFKPSPSLRRDGYIALEPEARYLYWCIVHKREPDYCSRPQEQREAN